MPVERLPLRGHKALAPTVARSSEQPPLGARLLRFLVHDLLDDESHALPSELLPEMDLTVRVNILRFIQEWIVNGDLGHSRYQTVPNRGYICPVITHNTGLTLFMYLYEGLWVTDKYLWLIDMVCNGATMTDLVMESADLLERKSVNDEGRLYLGKEFAGRDVEVAIKLLDEDDG